MKYLKGNDDLLASRQCILNEDAAREVSESENLSVLHMGNYLDTKSGINSWNDNYYISKVGKLDIKFRILIQLDYYDYVRFGRYKIHDGKFI